MHEIRISHTNHFYTFIRFALVGGLTTVIYFGLMWLVNSVLELNYMLAVSVAYIFSTIFHFFANKIFTFKSASTASYMQLGRYAVLWIVNYFVTLIVVRVAVEGFSQSPYLGVCISVPITMGIGYLLGHYWVFKED